MSKEKAIEYIKRAMDCIDELPFSDNGMLAFYDLEIALNKFRKSCEESYNNRVDDHRLDSRPPYLWQWMDDSDILIGNKVYRKPSFKPFLHLRDSEIKKIINQFNRYKI